MTRRGAIILSALATLVLIVLNLHESAYADSKSQQDILRLFNHRGHETSAFKAQGMTCASCHNFTINEATGEVTPTKGIETSIFSRELKSICHECHKTAEVKHRKAPKSCYMCHRGAAQLTKVAPRNHNNLEWRRSHATDARVGGRSCMNCHTEPECVKCHLQRNDIELVNHSRNFRMFHSVQARLEPHRCDSCHKNKNFCTDCHMNRK